MKKLAVPSENPHMEFGQELGLSESQSRFLNDLLSHNNWYLALEFLLTLTDRYSEVLTRRSYSYAIPEHATEESTLLVRHTGLDTVEFYVGYLWEVEELENL